MIAHDNRFNRWTAGAAQYFFATVDDCDARISAVLADPEGVEAARRAARERFREAFQWRMCSRNIARCSSAWRRVPRRAEAFGAGLPHAGPAESGPTSANRI